MTDADYLRLAFQAAAERSGDNSTQNGAILVPQAGPILSAANDVPIGVRPRLDRPAKYQRIEHAERAVVYAAARAGVSTLGSRLYCCWFACSDCARAIVVAGIREVVGHALPRQETPHRWVAEVIVGEQILREGGVSMRWLTGNLGCEILFDGERMKC
jgi:dCMP deaminase